MSMPPFPANGSSQSNLNLNSNSNSQSQSSSNAQSSTNSSSASNARGNASDDNKPSSVKPLVLHISHRTTYRYSTAVENAQHLATIRPVDCAWQRVLSYRETLTPAPRFRNNRVDAFGNNQLYFSLELPHASLQMLSETTVALTPRWDDLDSATTPAWEQVAATMRYRLGVAFHPETEFCFASPNIGLSQNMRQYAAKSFPPGCPLAVGAIDLMHRVYADFSYEPAATTYYTPAQKAFEMRHGVCQDFAQVMIGCLRALGLPARYVSGYLRNDPPPGVERLIGADASHAWVSVYCPGSGWIDLDPTNDILADLDHITLAIGRDYTDVSLLRGSLLGGGAHKIDVAVSVLAEDN